MGWDHCRSEWRMTRMALRRLATSLIPAAPSERSVTRHERHGHFHSGFFQDSPHNGHKHADKSIIPSTKDKNQPRSQETRTETKKQTQGEAVIVTC